MNYLRRGFYAIHDHDDRLNKGIDVRMNDFTRNPLTSIVMMMVVMIMMPVILVFHISESTENEQSGTGESDV